MGRSRSTIWRELQRNMIPTPHGMGYFVSKAQEQRNGRLRRSRRGPQHSPEDYALARRMIEARPERVEGRQELGHYEGDTVHGASWEKTCVVTLVERATGLVLVGRSPDKTVKSVNKVLIRLLDESPLPARTLTLDNGTEFHGYRAVEEATGVQIYFARPHHPWQRGCNENANGLLRQYWPKRASMGKLSQRQCDQVVHKLNSRPRKRYGYLSPLQLIT